MTALAIIFGSCFVVRGLFDLLSARWWNWWERRADSGLAIFQRGPFPRVKSRVAFASSSVAFGIWLLLVGLVQLPMWLLVGVPAAVYLVLMTWTFAKLPPDPGVAGQDERLR